MQQEEATEEELSLVVHHEELGCMKWDIFGDCRMNTVQTFFKGIMKHIGMVQI